MTVSLTYITMAIDRNRACQVIEDNTKDLSSLLQGSLQSFATQLWEKDLIEDETFHNTLDRSSNVFNSERQRTSLMLDCIYRKLLTNDSPILLKNFLEILKNEAVWRLLVKRLETSLSQEKRSNNVHPEAVAFKRHMEDLSMMLQSSLQSVAYEASAKGLLTDEEVEVIVDPCAESDHAHMTTILNEVYSKVVQDARHFEQFMQVIESIGPPVDRIASFMRREVSAR